MPTEYVLNRLIRQSVTKVGERTDYAIIAHPNHQGFNFGIVNLGRRETFCFAMVVLESPQAAGTVCQTPKDRDRKSRWFADLSK